MTTSPIRQFFRSGDLFIWLTASGVTLSLLMIGGLLVLIMVNGLGEFWPSNLWEVRLADGHIVAGKIVDREQIPYSESPEFPDGKSRIRVHVGNRDVFGADFQWIDEDKIVARETPRDLVRFERREWGPMYGRVQAIYEGSRVVREGSEAWAHFGSLIQQVNEQYEQIRRLEEDEIGDINYRLEALRLEQKALGRKNSQTREESDAADTVARKMVDLEEEYQKVTTALEALYKEAQRYEVGVLLSEGREVRKPLSSIIRAVRPNDISWFPKVILYLENFLEFVSGEPREANTEGGIFPAIFGTVLMVLIMTVAVMPFGVMAALYLREYARQGPLVRLVRIAVNNLAGVPSIVFGVFGLGFFIYAIGGTLDTLFYPEFLPNPTFGTGGILWASLTLALLTVPVVIVATEEGLSAVPRDFREGSIALGATKLETLWHVVIPCALPGILTGLILAMARAAGEVAPLMLTGVVKLAPALPVDEYFPFLHLDRKFMHLGFHIYDVGFQSPNVEAAKPMVYMTTLILIVVVVTLNLVAVMIRNHLRKRYVTSAV